MNSSQPHILHLCSIKGRGGTGYMASRLCRLLNQQGYQVTVGACAGSKMAERAVQHGMTVLPLSLKRGFHPLSLWRDFRCIRKYIRQNQVALLHCWHSIEYWTAALVLTGTRIPLIRTRGLVTPISGHFFNRRLHEQTTAVHATCQAVVQCYRQAGLSTETVHCLYDGVDLEYFKPDPDSGKKIRKECGIENDEIVIVSVARLEPVKGHRYLLEAVAALKHPRLHLLLAGDGSCREEILAQAEQLGVSRQLHLLGIRRDIPAILSAADGFALASIGSEGSSRAVMEALACDVPVVASTVGTLPDLLTGKPFGYLTAPQNSEALRTGLATMLEQLPDTLGAGKARAEAEKYYDEKQFAENISELYRQCLKKTAGGGASR